jgi:WD40 repeat protein
MNTKTDNPIIVMLGTKRGYAKIYNAKTNEEIDIQWHRAEIRVLTINSEGTLLASASTKGTLIRIFDTSQGVALKEVRRGSVNADIQWIAFSNQSVYLACTSDKGTAHVFSLCVNEYDLPEMELSDKDEDEPISMRRDSILSKNTDKSSAKNQHHMFKFMKNLFPYFSSEWSFAKIEIGGNKDRFTLWGFVDEDELVLVSKDAKSSSDFNYMTYTLSGDGPAK